MRRILFVIGTRPDAIKLAPVIRAANEHPDLQPIVVSTRQHTDVLDDVLDLFGIDPQYSLDVMSVGQSLASLSARLLTGLGPIMTEASPDMVIVQGDTTTSAMGALAAFYADIPLGHVEAGLRTGNPRSPFPEEMNRRLIGQLAGTHFPPTPKALESLVHEGIRREHALVTGNTGIDAFLAAQDLGPGITDPTLSRFASSGLLLVATTHRRENWGAGVRSVARALVHLTDRNEALHVIYAAHPNPAVQDDIRAEIGVHPRIHVADPIGYGEFARVLGASKLILTDSGGIQEEAPSLGIPVLVARAETERTEGVAAGVAELVGTDEAAIITAAETTLAAAPRTQGPSKWVNPYGDGHAAGRILEVLAGSQPDDVAPWE